MVPCARKCHVLELGRLLLEDIDEQVADDLALLLRIGHALEALEEAVLGIHPDDINAHVLGEGRHHLVALVQAQQAVVDEHADQSVADCPVQHRRHHRRIDAAGQAENHAAVADLLAHAAGCRHR